MSRFQHALILTLATWLALPGHGQEPAGKPAPGTLPPAATDPAPGPPPVSLTASDGTGLELVSFSARGVLESPLAFTELHLVFDNPHDRVIEGRFRLLLPPGAALSRFAMEVDGHWQEGEVLERQKARQVYEDFLYRRQDPALLEQQAANAFAARVFPIPARGRKRLIVSWSNELVRPGEPYRIPLAGLPRIEQLDLRVLVGRSGEARGVGTSDPEARSTDYRVVELTKRDWTPDRDFEVAQPAGAAPGLRHGDLLLLRLSPRLRGPAQPVTSLAVLVDTSASRALGFEAQLAALERLIDRVAGVAGRDAPVLVAAFDQDVELIFEGRAGDFGDAALQALQRRGALGASDLEAALSWLGGHLRGSKKSYARCLLLTDGVATAGDLTTAAAGAALSEMRGVERLDVMAFGGLRDDDMLASLVTRPELPQAGVVLDAAMPPDEQWRRLHRAASRGLEVEVEGAEWHWPQRLEGLQDGDWALVYAKLPAHRSLEVPKVTVGGRAVELGDLRPTEGALLERASVKARIDRLLALRQGQHAGDPDLQSAMARQVVELSVRHRVLSPFTALLVLETEADYRRYGIDREALSGILTVGLTGLELADRSPPKAPPPVPPLPVPPPPVPPRLPVPNPVPEPVVEAGSEPGEPGDSFFTEDFVATEEIRIEAPQAAPVAAVEPMPERGAPQDDIRARSNDIERELEGRYRRALADRSRRVLSDRQGAASENLAVAPPASRIAPDDRPRPPESTVEPYTGRFAEIMALVAAGRAEEARQSAESWRRDEPGEMLVWVALGEACELAGRGDRAARAYASLIDLFPARADIRRYAAQRLEALDRPSALALAVDSYRRALEQRPDHPSGHRLLAFALVKSGQLAEAFEVLSAVLASDASPAPRWDRFPGVRGLLLEDLGLVAAAWRAAEPEHAELMAERLRAAGASLATAPSLRFVLTWETAANDVDLHIHDAHGGHAYYSRKTLDSGGELSADVTQGFGPEGFVIPQGKKARAHPYRLRAHYYERGAMGYGLGKLQVVEHDGHGHLRFEEKPFVVMQDDAYVELGSYD